MTVGDLVLYECQINCVYQVENHVKAIISGGILSLRIIKQV